MKAQNVIVDINRLTTEELQQLQAMLYHQNREDCKKVETRIAYVEGWMSSRAEEEYYLRYCEGVQP